MTQFGKALEKLISIHTDQIWNKQENIFLFDDVSHFWNFWLLVKNFENLFDFDLESVVNHSVRQTVYIQNVRKRMHKHRANKNHSMLFSPKIDCHHL